MAYSSEWSLPAHSSDTEKQRPSKGRGGPFRVDARGDGGVNPFHSGNPRPLVNKMHRHGHKPSTGR